MARPFLRQIVLLAWREHPDSAARAEAETDVAAAFGARGDATPADAQLGLLMLAVAPELPDVGSAEVTGSRWRALRRLCEAAPGEFAARAALAFANADIVETNGLDPSTLHYPNTAPLSESGLSGRALASARDLSGVAYRCHDRVRKKNV